MSQLKIEYVPIGQLKPFEGNPRKNDESVDAVIKSIEAFGYTNPILARRANNEIIAGHTRVKALLKMGKKKAPVIFLDLDETDARVYSIFDNKSVENAEWDFPKLADLLVEFDQLNVDLDLTGFSLDEIEEIAPETFGQPQRDDDDVIPESPPPVCKEGDLWILGNHRLLCSDCRLQANVERLMGGVKADMVFTDPPYGVAVNQGTKEDLKKRNRRTDGKIVQNDDLVGEKLRIFLLTVFGLYYNNIKAGAVIYVCHAEGLGMDVIFRTAFAESGFKPAEIIIWAKDQFAFGRQDYHWRHEPIIYGWKIGAAHYFTDDHTQDTVWEIPRPKQSKEHPTMKPIALCAKGIGNSSKRNQTVLDFFLGSGTTLIACEKLNRRCYGMEIDEHYCDVIIKRWKDYTGKKAELDETHTSTD
ncbi:hypothetical protein LCGC14_0553700 [marine sediment metagenome]|uniref:ParB-like N-terminal domain-containing protein n=1 Tax=marine sediment metagenome TaxID=412755 RepID=A0A0F9RP55_9ZZZZ